MVPFSGQWPVLSVTSPSTWVSLPLSPVPIFADWDGDGSTDLVLTGTDKVQYFQRGVCTPSSPYCQQGTCSKQNVTVWLHSRDRRPRLQSFAVNSMSAMRVLVLAGNALAMTHWQGLAAVEAAGEHLASYANWTLLNERPHARKNWVTEV